MVESVVVDRNHYWRPVDEGQRCAGRQSYGGVPLVAPAVQRKDRAVFGVFSSQGTPARAGQKGRSNRP
eukprot:2458277-Lingulodinium_polyedra.AAC.1